MKLLSALPCIVALISGGADAPQCISTDAGRYCLIRPDAGTVAHSEQTDAGVAQKEQFAPDCKRFCLGKCWWDADAGYCQDTRVQRLGTWDPIPWEPEREATTTFSQ